MTSMCTFILAFEKINDNSDKEPLLQVTDPLGSVTQYNYYPEASPSGTGIQSVTGRIPDPNTGGYLHQLIMDSGNDDISQTFTYDEVGNITTMKD